MNWSVWPRTRAVSIEPAFAKALVVALGTLVLVLDLALPADLNVAIFYCFVIVLCAWTRSATFLVCTSAVFAVGTIAGLRFSLSPVTGFVSWVDWANRVFGIGALLLVTVFVYLRMRSFQSLEQTIATCKHAQQALSDSEARLRLAQAAGGVGTWEWNPANSDYKCSDQCYTIFGIDPSEPCFWERWMSAADPEDLKALQAGFVECAREGDFELEYRHHHPALGPRWVYCKAKKLHRDSAESRLFGIFQDITERKKMEESLRTSNSTLELLVDQRTAALRKLSTDLLRTQDEERRKIARELHDSVGQYLATLKINLDTLAVSEHPSEPRSGSRSDLLADCRNMVQHCIVETRTISHLLHPPLLEEVGLASAVRWYIEGFAQRTGIQVNLDLLRENRRFEPAVELALFRVLQESLTNVYRHSGSSVIDVGLTLDSENLALEVRDYGRGMSAELLKRYQEVGTGGGVGLAGMRERLTELGGKLDISSDTGGTTVHARVCARQTLEADSISAA